MKETLWYQVRRIAISCIRLKFVKKVYMSESVGPSSRGRPHWRWRDRVKQYMCERGASRDGGLDQAKRECLDRERWRFFCQVEGYELWDIK